jgi:hypothetical protein
MQGAAWRLAIDTGFARPTDEQIAPDFIFCFRGRFIAILLQEGGKPLSTVAQVHSAAIDAAGGIAVVCRSVDEVAAVLEAIGMRSYASADHRLEAAALLVQ